MGDTTQQLIQDFKKLSLKDKKQKLSKVIDFLHTKNEALSQVKEALQSNPRVDDEFCDGVYGDIMMYAEAVQQHNNDKAQQALQYSQNRLQQLHEQEEREKVQESQELNAMLDNL